MVSSKELLEVLCLLKELPTDEKTELLRYFRAQGDTEGNSRPPAFSREKAE